jgi:phage terminase large subunit-like protein
MKNYKYHEYIDTWFDLVLSGKVKACKEQFQLIEMLKKVLVDPNVIIDINKIYGSVEVVNKYFPFALLDFQNFSFLLLMGWYIRKLEIRSLMITSGTWEEALERMG